MQWLVDMIAGLVAVLAAAALSLLGLNLDAPSRDREVERVRDCGHSAQTTVAVVADTPPADC